MSASLTASSPAPRARKDNKPMVVHHTIFTVDNDLERSARSKNKPARFRDGGTDEEERSKKQSRILMPPPLFPPPLPIKYRFLSCTENFDFADLDCYPVGESLALDCQHLSAESCATSLTHQIGPPASLPLSELFAF